MSLTEHRFILIASGVTVATERRKRDAFDRAIEIAMENGMVVTVRDRSRPKAPSWEFGR